MISFMRLFIHDTVHQHIPSKRHFWRWFSFSQGGICHVLSWLICCQAATYAVGDAVNCRQVDVNVGVRTLQNLRHEIRWTWYFGGKFLEIRWEIIWPSRNLCIYTYIDILSLSLYILMRRQVNFLLESILRHYFLTNRSSFTQSCA